MLGERVRSGSEDSEVRLSVQLCVSVHVATCHLHSSSVSCLTWTPCTTLHLAVQSKRNITVSHLRVPKGDGFRLQDLFQLGVILLRKKLYTQACKNLEKAKRNWGGDPEELAQVRTLVTFG